MLIRNDTIRLPSHGLRDAIDGPRLAASDGNRRSLAGVGGWLLARPWLDQATLTTLKHGFFPLSRLWAAAGAADGSVETFWAESGAPRRHEKAAMLARTLARHHRAQVVAMATDAAWERVFFGLAETSVTTRVALEQARHDHRHAFNRTRFGFLPLLSRHTPRARLNIASPEQVATVYGGDADRHFIAPATMPDVQVSHPVPAVNGTDRWLRFSGPSARVADDCYARVHTPHGVSDPPTVILGHGICVEFDHWHGLIDETQALVARGIRVIRPEAPWHGRRTPFGYYGGERAIGAFPLGMLDLMVAAIREWAVLAYWSRQTSNGPLGIAGTSLGALTAQLTASVAHNWPRQLQPEAMYLITHSGTMSEGMMTGATSTLFADPIHAARKGWTLDTARRYLSMIDPVLPPVMPADRIVSVLGDRDVITPYEGGAAVVRRWQIPDANVFVSRNGHFTIPMRLIRDRAPTARFAEIMNRL